MCNGFFLWETAAVSLDSFVFLSGESEVVLLYSRYCPGSIEWAKYLHKLFTELAKHKGRLRCGQRLV